MIEGADFSSEMLKGFLRARVEMAGYNAVFPGQHASTKKQRPAFDAARKAEMERIRKRAGVTVVQFDLAWMGRALSVQPREKLWRALGVDLDLYGVKLVDYGKWEKIQ
ncbi:hypothetical protein ACK9YZ_01240 [Rhizobium sp. ZK1]|uniref:hypothetical protein n=1 Tax=Rhizobium sp. ZK1 TaxID=3389872 RepID=UPI0039F6C76C